MAINPTDRVALDNLNTWEIHIHGIDSDKDIMVPKSAKNWKQLNFAEVEAQVKSMNKSFCGTDGLGSHASIRIVDEEVRKAAFGLEGDKIPKQRVLDLDAMKELLSITNQSAFTKKLKEYVVTNAEKRRIIMLAKEAGIDSAEYYKVKAIEELTETTIR